LPLPSATEVQSVLPPSFTATVLPGSAVPVKVGVLSFVVAFAAGAVTAGATGALLSTVKLVGGVVVVPPGSLICATTVFGPSVIGVVGMQLQLPAVAPPASIVAVQSTGPLGCCVTVTVPPGVPVPVNVGVVSLMGEPAVGDVMLDAVLLTVNGVVVVGPVLPAGSVAVVASVCGPLHSGVVVQLHVPSA
jgi:hypothetical protein